jgi:hypothetical protein
MIPNKMERIYSICFYKSLSSLRKFIVVVFSPKNIENRIFSPDRERLNMVVVKSANAIDRDLSPTFLLIASYEKNVLTRISPIRS